jgi:hypothetical protein
VPRHDGQRVAFEDPAALPFDLPRSLEDVTAGWFTQLLHHRGMIPDGVSVARLTQKGAPRPPSPRTAISCTCLPLRMPHRAPAARANLHAPARCRAARAGVGMTAGYFSSIAKVK